MRILYIGHYDEGSTSKMRGEILKKLIPSAEFLVINIDVPIYKTQRLLRSLGWRYKIGPLITNINNYILAILNGNFQFDIVWIDKGVFIEPDLIFKLRKESTKLVHYTPDPAFEYQRSHLFYKALSQYDYCVTTKSYELDYYKQYGVKTIFCTQGFDPELHKPYYDFEQKNGVVFIGHWEEERGEIIAKLVEANIQVTVAGNHWGKFSRARANKTNLIYKGKGVFGTAYAEEISKAKVGLGFLSKWVPELHTTRSFEIPACGTALVTERNREIESIFSDKDVIYYNDPAEAVSRITDLIHNSDELRAITERGYKVVTDGGYNYTEILKRVLKQINE